MPFKKGEGGRPKGTKNKTNAALSQAIAAAAPQTPLAVMLEVMTYYHRQWKRLEDGPDRRFAAELTMSAARLAAPYCHAKKVIIEDETPVTVTVVDRREVKQVIDVHPNGHANGQSNGHANGHGGNGSDPALN